MVVDDNNVFFAYRGETWIRDTGGQPGQANQFFHYKTNGTFVGQFGMPGFIDGTPFNSPGAAGNVMTISIMKTNGAMYIYTNDEWSHGVHRWRVDL